MIWTSSYHGGVGRTLDLSVPRLMAILNVTPDSFSDGGVLNVGTAEGVAQVVLAARRAVEQGASVLDIGGESTRPGAERVGADEQLARVIPAILGVRAALPGVVITIDTTLAAVAAGAFDAGADAVNDVSAGTESRGMLALCAARGRGITLMHRRAMPGADSYSTRYGLTGEREAPTYGDCVHEVGEFLARRALAAMDAGVPHRAIVIDPGLGFGKTVEQNLELIERTGELAELGYPVLSGISRKSFVGAWAAGGQAAGLGVEPLGPGHTPAQRDGASALLAARHVAAGARLVRIHNVAAHSAILTVRG